MAFKKVKIQYEGDIRRAKLAIDDSTDASTVADLRALIGRLFGSAVAEAKVRYCDEDGDMVLICTDDDLNDAFEQAKAEEKKSLKLFVEKVKKDKKSKKAKNPEPKPQPKKSSDEETGEWQKVKIEEEPSEKNAQPLEKNDDLKEPPLRDPSAEKRAKRAEKRALKEERRQEKEERRREKEERRQKMKEMRKAKWESAGKGGAEDRKQHGGGRGGHGHGHWRSKCRQRKEARSQARSEFCEEIKSFLADKKVISAIQEALPQIADSLLKGVAVKDIIDSVLESHEALKNHPLVQRLLPLAVAALDLLPIDLISPVLLDVVLELQGLVQDGDIASMPLRALMKRVFRCVKRSARQNAPEVHHGVVCDVCGDCVGPIVGPRWKKNGENYDLCDEHYQALGEEDKKDYQKVAPHGWRPPCAFGIPGFHPGPYAFMNMFGPPGPPFHRGPWNAPPHGPPHGPHRGWGRRSGAWTREECDGPNKDGAGQDKQQDN